MLKTKFLIRLGLVVLTGLVLYFLLSNINYGQVMTILERIDKIHLVIVLFLISLINIFKGYRFYWLLVSNNIKLSVFQSIKAYLAGQLTSSLPGGEATRGILLKNHYSISLVDSSGPVVIQSLLEVLTAMVIVLIGSAVIDDLLIPTIISAVVMGVIIFIFVNKKAFTFLMDKVLQNRFTKMKKKILLVQNSIQQTLLKQKSTVDTRVITAIAIGFIANLLGGLLFYVISLGLHIPIHILASIFIYSASIFVQVVGQIVPGGLGLTEGGIIGVLLLMNVSWNQAVALVVIFRLVTFFFPLLVSFILTLVFYRDIFNFKKTN